MLHVELSGANGASVIARSLLTWQQRFAQTLKLPRALATFLVDDLGLSTPGYPPTEVALWLAASTVLTELVDIDRLTVVPGSPQLSEFTGYAAAEADGLDGERLALAWLRTMSDSCLHLDGSAAALASLARTGEPPLRVAILEDEWQVWRHLLYIVALKIKITNTTDTLIQFSGMGVGCDWGGAASAVPSVSQAKQIELEREKEALVRQRYSPRLNMHSVVEPHESVSGWLVTDVPWLGPQAGTPQLTVSVQEAVGNEYLTVIPRKEAQTFGP